MISTSHGSNTLITRKIFLPGLVNLYISTLKAVTVNTQSHMTWYAYNMKGDGENKAWEYWKNKIGTNSPLQLHEANANLKIRGIAYSVNTSSNLCWSPNQLKKAEGTNGTNSIEYQHVCIDSIGSATRKNCTIPALYLPACVIG